ncbi:hypothetical protein KL925_004278 [Ogataea polymorpha]|nr:hypothetical protein KL937_003621 [Ogataea polymorpha]KAG7899527.1 hypothetical protein KL935_003837 [Ogataea polymorpha]KAG7904742.1 hypothetical protein KL907_003618 [Ogataea polymorpha]KAG7907481.1 hypothetical protein KL906_003562 [Ogataea polymorpha]KAG7915413.1 hypothetical protein KL927_003689 [Ogataea polymorpha]
MQQLECAVETAEVDHDGCVFPTFLHKHSGEYKGRIVFIHGYRDIYELFFGLFNVLTANGYDVHFHYQRGEGTSRPAGNVQSSNDDSRVYKDMDFFIKRNLESDEKVILMGHSMGGGLILNYSAFGTYRERLLMTVACSPLIELSPETAVPKHHEWAIRALCWAVPPARYVRIKTPLKVEYVSSLPEVQQFIQSKTPPAKLTATAIEARDFVLRGKRLLQPELYTRYDKNLPIAILHGNADHINDCRASKTFIDNLQSAGCTHASYTELDGAAHNLAVEPCSDIFFRQLLNILDANRRTGQ